MNQVDEYFELDFKIEGVIHFSIRSVFRLWLVNGLDSFQTHSTRSLCVSISFNFAFALSLLVLSNDIHHIHVKITTQQLFMIDVESQVQSPPPLHPSRNWFEMKLHPTWKCHVLQLYAICSMIRVVVLYKACSPLFFSISKPTLYPTVFGCRRQTPQRNTSQLLFFVYLAPGCSPGPWGFHSLSSSFWMPRACVWCRAAFIRMHYLGKQSQMPLHMISVIYDDTWGFCCQKNVKRTVCAGGTMLGTDQNSDSESAAARIIFYHHHLSDKSLIKFPETRLIKISITAFHIKSIFWYSTMLLFADYVIRKPSHRCLKHLEADLRRACSIIHSSLLYSYLAFLFCLIYVIFQWHSFSSLWKQTFSELQF